VRFFRALNGTNDSNHDVNMTPLIDVSLVLVVMLLLATPLAFESSIDVKNAAQAARKAQ
jgi:biopolymer transport protein ExbD